MPALAPPVAASCNKCVIVDAPGPLHPRAPALRRRNPVDDSDKSFKRPSRNRVYAFRRELEARGEVAVSVRETRGLEAAAACGQLRNMHQKTPLDSYALPL